jgi:hypothetical protein
MHIDVRSDGVISKTTIVDTWSIGCGIGISAILHTGHLAPCIQLSLRSATARGAYINKCGDLPGWWCALSPHLPARSCDHELVRAKNTVQVRWDYSCCVTCHAER